MWWGEASRPQEGSFQRESVCEKSTRWHVREIPRLCILQSAKYGTHTFTIPALLWKVLSYLCFSILSDMKMCEESTISLGTYFCRNFLHVIIVHIEKTLFIFSCFFQCRLFVDPRPKNTPFSWKGRMNISICLVVSYLMCVMVWTTFGSSNSGRHSKPQVVGFIWMGDGDLM